MKKTLIGLFAAAIIAVAGVASATPVYFGNTDGAGFTATDAGYQVPKAPPVNDPTMAGYYVWSNDPARTNWSVRWTGGAISPVYTWFGSVEFQGRDLLTAGTVRWDGTASDGTLHVELNGFTQDLIAWTRATAGNGWDGFDFTIANEGAEPGKVIGFNLGSTLFSSLTNAANVLGTGIFIGDGKAIPMVTVDNFRVSGNTLGKSQNFEIPAPVPEPGTLLLLGSGLVGLAYLKRRKKA